MGHTELSSIDRAIGEIAAGRPVIVVDDPDRENEGDLVFAAARATPRLVGFAVRYTSGVLCAPLTGAACDELALQPMCRVNQDRRRTAYTVSVDARDGVSTGISAHDRAHTLRLLADDNTAEDDLCRPGHVFPLRAREGGVLVRAGHTEAAIDLTRLAGLPPAGVIAELVNDDGTMQRMPELRRFAMTHQLALITIADLITYRRRQERVIERVASP
jgi:3,4-dihydroxy 2-butanone 4-phosphate synthase/GTP cyclohydrolase II